MTRRGIPASPMARLQFVAEVLDAPLPEGLPRDLLDRDGAPARAVLRFCRTHGASLDFIYLGCVETLVRYTSRAMKAEERA